MDARSRRMATRSVAALALALVALVVVFALYSGADPGPRILQAGRLLSWPKVVAMSSSGGGKPACEGFRGKSEETSADGGVTSARAESAPLARCSSGTLLGGWDNSTYVPLPYDALAPFLAEARGVLSRAERHFFLGRKNGVDVAPEYLPVNSPVGLSAQPPENESVAFFPPCYYHFYNQGEIVRLFAGKWVFFLGDSNTRGVVLGLLVTLDPSHRWPYSDEIWFNGTKEEINWPHVNDIHYFFREDGSILFKTGRGDDHALPPLPESGYSFRLSYKMTHVRTPNAFICTSFLSIAGMLLATLSGM